jgi:hypothetical protein
MEGNMNQCHLCGCSLSQLESVCPACFTSVQPREITWDEMKQRLVAAGWTEAKADEEIQSMQEETESGM